MWPKLTISQPPLIELIEPPRATFQIESGGIVTFKGSPRPTEHKGLSPKMSDTEEVAYEENEGKKLLQYH
ncbi:hypothetical protein PDJAM_G00105400 [Pangasius djambal]|uniref:Uncharacterized protein n=1 Tax=Pangasius djambal TaxID=1691987 RepID=A0ACC5Y0X0_9TELE|nr:hypothetical protein [Pangasius djambal]